MATVTYAVKDAKGKQSFFILNFADSSNMDVLKTFATSTALMVDDLVKGQVVGITINMGVALPIGIKAAPLATADVEERGRFVFRCASGSVTSVTVPTFDELGCLPFSDLIDPLNEFVDTFIYQMVNGETDGLVTAAPSDDRGSDITNLDNAVMVYRRY
jgi:hypothetical protein